MKSQIACFVGGLIISWAVWSTVDHLKCRPHDPTDSVPRDALALMQEYDAVLPWFRDAYSLKLGAFKIVKPADPRNASAFVTPLDDGYPRIYLFDNDTNGRPDSIMVQDSALHAIGVSDRDGDGKFDAHDFSTGMRSNSVSFIDGNMDGQFDLRLGPGRKAEVYLEGRWYEVIQKDKKTFIEDNGMIKEVIGSNAVYRVKDPK